ncbi:unnamed protein product [Haemonchus placei]|uniref:CCHC-type domain-containing protein n=1 Tax=Haemonchus placei TaxID=6290 RepID=A0A0N4WHQ9_HAEPC|nr:unnamed protein product [Haemonchus placei]
MPKQSLPSSRARPYSFRNRDKEQAPRKVRGRNNRSPVVVQCTCCGGQGHAALQCFKRQTSHCTVCSRPGHMARACRTRMPNTKKVFRPINWCAEPSISDLDEVESSGNNIDRLTHKVRQGRREELDKLSRPAEVRKTAQDRLVRQSIELQRPGDKPPCRKVKVEPAAMLKIRIQGTDVTCELDTGASVSTLDLASWRRIGEPPLSEATIEATAYNNSPIHFSGKCTVLVEFKGKQAKMDLHVLEGATHTLCGRDMIRALEINCEPHYPSIYRIEEKFRENAECRLAKILEENKALFKPGLGKCITTQATLKFKTVF